jgi:electron transport complex protein RnfD
MKLRTAPHWLGNNSIPLMMRRVLLALLPACVCVWLYFGWGFILNLLFLCAACLGIEAVALALRRRDVKTALGDGSALVTAVLIALAMPPLAPWWVSLTAAVFAVGLAKHAYGGLGHNPFNPAMVGYVTVLVAFPQHLSAWPAIGAESQWLSLHQTWQYFLWGPQPGFTADAFSGATPLDSIKMQLGQMRTMSEITAQDNFGWLAGRGWEWINLATAAGGLWLLRKAVISWHVPASMLATMALLYFAFYAVEPATNPSPVSGLLSGGTMLAAFFIATDPVSGAASNAGRIIFGVGAGLLCFALRRWGAYPDGIAFAILLMNMSVPLIDRFTVPRIYGRRNRP